MNTSWVETQDYERKAHALMLIFTHVKVLFGSLHDLSAVEKKVKNILHFAKYNGQAKSFYNFEFYFAKYKTFTQSFPVGNLSESFLK